MRQYLDSELGLFAPTYLDSKKLEFLQPTFIRFRDGTPIDPMDLDFDPTTCLRGNGEYELPDIWRSYQFFAPVLDDLSFDSRTKRYREFDAVSEEAGELLAQYLGVGSQLAKIGISDATLAVDDPKSRWMMALFDVAVNPLKHSPLEKAEIFQFNADGKLESIEYEYLSAARPWFVLVHDVFELSWQLVSVFASLPKSPKPHSVTIPSERLSDVEPALIIRDVRSRIEELLRFAKDHIGEVYWALKEDQTNPDFLEQLRKHRERKKQEGFMTDFRWTRKFDFSHPDSFYPEGNLTHFLFAVLEPTDEARPECAANFERAFSDVWADSGSLQPFLEALRDELTKFLTGAWNYEPEEITFRNDGCGADSELWHAINEIELRLSKHDPPVSPVAAQADGSKAPVEISDDVLTADADNSAETVRRAENILLTQVIRNQMRETEAECREPLKMELVGKQIPTAPTHTSDFRSVNWFGQTYDFSASQAACVKVMWKYWAQGTLGAHQLTIIDEAGLAGERFRDTFRTNRKTHPAWGVMIVGSMHHSDVKRGTFRLIDPKEIRPPIKNNLSLAKAKKKRQSRKKPQ